MNWLKVNFSQAFSAWIHLKALRVFTESVLRYLPAYVQIQWNFRTRDTLGLIVLSLVERLSGGKIIH